MTDSQLLTCIFGSVMMMLGLYGIAQAFMPDLRPKEGVFFYFKGSRKQIKGSSLTISLFGAAFTSAGVAAFAMVNPQLKNYVMDFPAWIMFVSIVGSLISLKFDEISNSGQNKAQSFNGQSQNSGQQTANEPSSDSVSADTKCVRSEDEINSLGQN